MTIVSVSLSEESLRDLERIKAETGLSGTSEVMRAALAHFTASRVEQRLEPTKHYTAALSIVLPESQQRSVHKDLHAYNAVIRSQNHLCISDTKCLELLGLHGTGAQIEALIQQLERVTKVEKLRLHVETCAHEH